MIREHFWRGNAILILIDALSHLDCRAASMAGFVEGVRREQSTLFPAQLDDYVAEDNPVRAVDSLDLDKLGFLRIQPLDVGRPGYHPRTMLKLYIYGYLNRVPSSRRLERECQRNIEVIWLIDQLAPDFKTIADFRKDNGRAIREVCPQFVALCPKLDLLSAGSVAIAGSKFVLAEPSFAWTLSTRATRTSPRPRCSAASKGSTKASRAISRNSRPPTAMATRCQPQKWSG